MLVDLFQCYLSPYESKNSGKDKTVVEYKGHSDSITRTVEEITAGVNQNPYNLVEAKLDYLVNNQSCEIFSYDQAQMINEVGQSAIFEKVTKDLRIVPVEMDNSRTIEFRLVSDQVTLGTVLTCDLYTIGQYHYYKLISYSIDFLAGYCILDNQVHTPSSYYVPALEAFPDNTVKICPITNYSELINNVTFLPIENEPLDYIIDQIKKLIEAKLVFAQVYTDFDESSSLLTVGLDIRNGGESVR